LIWYLPPIFAGFIALIATGAIGTSDSALAASKKVRSARRPQRSDYLFVSPFANISLGAFDRLRRPLTGRVS
jgi:hypothetical protein